MNNNETTNSKELVIMKLYEKYNFLVDTYDKFKEIINNIGSDEDAEMAIDKYVISSVKNGNFEDIFKKFLTAFGPIEAFNYFDNLCQKYDDFELSDDDISILLNLKGLSNFYNRFIMDHRLISKVSNNILLMQVLGFFQDAKEIELSLQNTAVEDDYTFSDSHSRDYLIYISKIPILSHEEEVELFKRFKNGDSSAKDEIVYYNLRLVVSIAKQYASYCENMTLMDIIQEGNIGLLDAIDKFEFDRGFKFSTYATWWIRQKIIRAIDDKERTIRIPIHTMEVVRKIKRIKDAYFKENYCEITDEELVEKLGIKEKDFERYKNLPSIAASLDQKVSTDSSEDSTFGDFVPSNIEGYDCAIEPVEKYAEDLDIKRELEEIIKKCANNEREIKVIKYRFGLDNYPELTLEQVGQKFGVTRERIRQIESKMIRKMIRFMRLRHIEAERINTDSIAKNDKVANFIAYCKENNINLDIISYSISKSYAILRCNVCDSLFRVSIDKLENGISCPTCLYYKNKDKSQSEDIDVVEGIVNENEATDSSQPLKLVKDLIIEPESVINEALARLPYNDRLFILKHEGKVVTKSQRNRYETLIKKMNKNIQRRRLKDKKIDNGNNGNSRVRK